MTKTQVHAESAINPSLGHLCDRDGKDRDRDRDRGKSDRSKKEVVKIEKEPSNGSAHSNG